MINVPLHPNSIQIPTIQSNCFLFLNDIYIFDLIAGCCKVEFDTVYPAHLNGIISRDEFQESIKKINQAFSYMKNWVNIAIVIFILNMIVGVALFGVTGAKVVKSSTSPYPFFIPAICCIMLGSISLSLSIFAISLQRIKKLRKAVAQESLKYSSRTPIPCSWRLDVVRYWFRSYGHNNNVYYQVRIDFLSALNSVYNRYLSLKK